MVALDPGNRAEAAVIGGDAGATGQGLDRAPAARGLDEAAGQKAGGAELRQDIQPVKREGDLLGGAEVRGILHEHGLGPFG